MESNFCQRDADKRLTTREVAESVEEQGSREGRRGCSACEGNVGFEGLYPMGKQKVMCLLLLLLLLSQVVVPRAARLMVTHPLML